MLDNTEFEGHVFVRQLGTGQYGVARLFRNVATGEMVAVKVGGPCIRILPRIEVAPTSPPAWGAAAPVLCFASCALLLDEEETGRAL